MIQYIPVPISSAPGRLAGSSRGQLLVVIALLLATVFVGLAVVVNSGIYTENLATRENTDPEAVGIEQAAIDDGVLEAVNRVNADVEDTSYTAVTNEFNSTLAAYNASLKRKHGTNGRYVDVRKTGTVEGVRIRQTDESRNFTSKLGDWNWTLTDGTVDEAGHFTMNLREGSLYEMGVDTTLAAMAKSAFGVEFDLESGGTWRVYFFEGAVTDTIYAIVEESDQTFRNRPGTAIKEGYLDQSCAVQGDSVSVRLNQSTYGGLYCEEFDFYAPGAIGDHSVRFVNAKSEFDPAGLLGGDTASDRARGTYDIMLGTDTPNESALHAPGGGEPWHQAAIYRVDYDIVFESTDTAYRVDNRQVKPTRSDIGGVIRQHPNVDRFEVDNRSDALGRPTYDIDWAVSDVDRDLERVELHLVHDSTGTDLQTETVVNETVVSVQNGSARGQDPLCACGLTGSIGDEYRVQITVVDTSGRATTESAIH